MTKTTMPTVSEHKRTRRRPSRAGSRPGSRTRRPWGRGVRGRSAASRSSRRTGPRRPPARQRRQRTRPVTATTPMSTTRSRRPRSRTPGGTRQVTLQVGGRAPPRSAPCPGAGCSAIAQTTAEAKLDHSRDDASLRAHGLGAVKRPPVTPGRRRSARIYLRPCRNREAGRPRPGVPKSVAPGRTSPPGE